MVKPKSKPVVYLASPVFREIADNKKVSQKWRQNVIAKWEELQNSATVIVSEKRFPTTQEIAEIVKIQKVDFIGCHLSHAITKQVLEVPSVKAVATSTAGFNHIENVPGILITHTPSVLDRAVADYTIAIILANLRNLINLHNFLWNGAWKPDQKWDLDENLNNSLDNLVLGLVGLGEIGREVTRRLAPMGIKILYYDIVRNIEFEKKYSNVTFIETMEQLFAEADVVSIHIPLNDKTKGVVGEKLLRKMKPNSVLVNTARGPIIDFAALISLLKSKEITIHLAFDVYDPEPISAEILKQFQSIAIERPELRFLFIPHNASADADTRAEMSTIILSDLITLAKSKSPEDLKSLRLIPSQKKLKEKENYSDFSNYRINAWWK